ncbi:MAG: putative RNA uridine N3 methyltransferase [Candidatus Njordarchaeales archaeon]
MIKLVAIPSTYTADEKNLLLRTYKIGLIARACATFGITDIGIYYDPDPMFDSHGLGRFIVKVLKYLNTPPYLRKTAFGVDDSLKYIGVTEPLKTPHHLDKEYKVPYRYAYVKRILKNELVVTDSSREYVVKKTKAYKEGERIVVIDTKQKIVIDKRRLPLYFGYDVFYFNRELVDFLKKLRKRNFLIIGTSRYGEDIREVKIPQREKIAIIFGSPFRGLREILREEKYMKYFDYFVNTVPKQTVKTIRTEEALFYTLAILRYKKIL